MKKRKQKQFIGIDEVGRGPLAGPVAVGAVLVHARHSKRVTKLFPVVKDSKKLSAKMREAWMVKIEEARDKGWLAYAVVFIAPSIIDKKGIAYAVRIAIRRALETISQRDKFPSPRRGLGNFSRWNMAHVLLDGGLRAPAEYKHQKTIIKGDEKELVIALASIVAKVMRDARMVMLGKKLPAYGFERHKGYGTRAHYAAIKKYGITPHHRKSFLKGI